MHVRRAFTILELLLVILVISLFAAVTIPAFFERAEVSLENASILLAQDLRAAQNRSAYLGEESLFHFHRAGDGYWVSDRAGELVENPATAESFVRSYSADGVFHGVRIANVDAGADRVFTIDGEGRPVENARITLTYGEDSRTLAVEKGSGRVTILGSTSGWVDRGY